MNSIFPTPPGYRYNVFDLRPGVVDYASSAAISSPPKATVKDGVREGRYGFGELETIFSPPVASSSTPRIATLHPFDMQHLVLVDGRLTLPRRYAIGGPVASHGNYW